MHTMCIWYYAQCCKQYRHAVSMDPNFRELKCSLEKKHVCTYTSWKELSKRNTQISIEGGHRTGRRSFLSVRS